MQRSRLKKKKTKVTKNPSCLKSDRTKFLYDPQALFIYFCYINSYFIIITFLGSAHWNVSKLKIMMIYLDIFIPEITQNVGDQNMLRNIKLS